MSVLHPSLASAVDSAEAGAHRMEAGGGRQKARAEFQEALQQVTASYRAQVSCCSAVGPDPDSRCFRLSAGMIVAAGWSIWRVA